MAVGRISGPLLKDNLHRNGVNLAFETNLLYLDVVNSRVGIKTASPTHDLSVNGTTRTTNLYASGTSNLGLITFSGSTISSNNSTITFSPSGPNATIYQGTVLVGNLSLTGSTLSATSSNTDININPSGTGQLVVNSNALINGNLHATGNITADGNISLGNATTDTISFTGEVNSDILPSATNTYSLGSNSLYWKNVYTNNLYATTINVTTLNATDFKTSQLDISGNTISAITANTDINFATSGTGGVIFGNLKFNTNSITNISPNAVTVFQESGNTANFTANITTGTGAVFTGSISGNVLSVTSTPSNSFGGALSFNGSNQWLSFTPGIQFGSTAYTFECYFYQTASSANATLIGGPTSSFAVNLINTSSIQITFVGSTTKTYSATWTTNSWNHIAVTRNASGQETVFLNGTRSSTGVLSDTTNYTGFTNLVGASTGGTNLFTGQITTLRIITANNIYDPTQTTITVPTTPLSSFTGTKYLLNATNAVTALVDTSGTQTTSQGGAGTVAYSNTSPFGTGTTGIAVGQVITGTGISPGTYVVSNVSGTGTSTTSSWTLNIAQVVSSETITATPVTMNVTAVASGTIQNGAALSGLAILPGTFITVFGTGTGGTGTYFISAAQTAVAASITSTISGNVKISGTYGVVIPSGNISQRPSVLYEEVGMIRYNTELGLVEVFSGTVWTSVAGTSTGVTSATAQDIGVQTALALG